VFGSGRNFLKNGHTARALYSRLGEFERFHNELPVTSKLAEQLRELPDVAEDLARSRKGRLAKPHGHAAKDPVATRAAETGERVSAAGVPRALVCCCPPPGGASASGSIPLIGGPGQRTNTEDEYCQDCGSMLNFIVRTSRKKLAERPCSLWKSR